MTNSNGAVVISAERIYEEVRALADGLTRLESKMDGFINESKDIRHDVADHEARIRTLESGRWPLPAFGAITGFLGATGAIIAIFTR